MYCLCVTKLLKFLSIISLIGKCDNYFNSDNNQYIVSMNNQLSPDLRIYLMTWNIKSEQPKCDLMQLLNISSEITNSEIDSLPDIYVIGLQEAPFNILFPDQWKQAFDKLFSQLNFIRLKSIKLVGVLLIVYTKRQLLHKFRSIQTQYTRTGLGGLWGNKGGVSVSLTIDGISICFVNSHLAPHYEQLEQRINDYNTIIDDQKFDLRLKHTQILSHDYVIWIGDLNFRIDDLTGDQIHEIIGNVSKTKSANNYEKLLEKDQLNSVRREGRAFSEFSETAPTFPPTYKFFVNTDSYDYKSRKPAYTDRILYKFTSNAYEPNRFLDLQQIEYKSHPQYKQSDHKPVSALFLLKQLEVKAMGARNLQTVDTSLSDELFVTFLPIRDWKVEKDVKAWYTIEPNDENSLIKLSNWDWIGLFKENFMSTEEQITYVWANPSPTSWSRPRQSSSSDSSSSSSPDGEYRPQTPSDREPWFSVTFSDILVADRYRLVYITQEGDVLGISEPFDVTN